jgi:divalent metal cation (Fe/Co/Zn/Cd) transporter
MSDNINKLYKKGVALEYFTIGYNTLEAAASIFFGIISGSIALVGFGLDSIVESLSGGVLLWRLTKHGKISEEEEEKVEKKAMKFVAITFFVLGAYVFYESLKKIISKEAPSPSLPGIVIAFLSLIVMPSLAYQKVKIGRAIKSSALIADAKETIACAFLSVALLFGLGANYLFGFWAADPIAGLVIVVFLVREGIEAWSEAHEETGDEKMGRCE